jgi:hypothetical protein
VTGPFVPCIATSIIAVTANRPLVVRRMVDHPWLVDAFVGNRANSWRGSRWLDSRSLKTYILAIPTNLVN